ncbi:MAG: molecular chaperone SurA [SAR86 cluster bacterium]|uniref:Chaperone SurA n=1 Tax=SAR86 cluster bacterium TaxID=2030880 RepID=A0A2A5CDX8_9GAMM|nr:peptidylprolyl isomerase [Gammaproteobacteria bacterium AH-315-E17]PCJ41721.1 MAG: molecular chaperone SurA [SAR86 cluster bacterium]
MLKTINILFSLVLLLAIVPVQAQLSDRVIAVVDNDVILESEFTVRMNSVREQIAAGTIPRGIPIEELESQLLDQLILENLQSQLAIRSGIRIDDNTLNQALTTIAQQNNMSFDEFRSVLNQDGQYQSFREQIRQDMMLNNLQSGTINQRITITRQEIENYLRSEAAQADISPEYRVQHILVPVDNPTQNALQKELADLIYQQLQDGADILELSASRQILGLPVGGGDLAGWRKAESLPTMFRSVVPDMEIGEITEPFTSDNGFHIVKLVEKRGGVDLQVDQAQLRHILIQPNEIRTAQQSEDLIHELYQRIQDGEDFGDLARVFTDDPGSMVSGGDLGWMTQGQLPPLFEVAVSELTIGELSQPFQNGESWHIAQLMDRRVEDVTEENARFQAEQILRERKYDNELENWLTEIRDTAYVDIRLGEESD